MIDSALRRIRFALRQFRLSPGFALGVALTFALGIGANTAIFSVIHGVLLRPLPFTHGSRLVLLRQTRPRAGFVGVSGRMFDLWQERSHTIEQLTGADYDYRTIEDEAPERLSA